MKGMGKSRWLSWAAALSLMFLFAVSAWAQAPVKNVILLIGDGMGINQISAARLSLADGARSVLNLDTMPYTGFSLNFANNNLVTDSAGKSVLQKRLNDKRREIDAILPMIEFSTEMVAVVFYDAFDFSSPQLMQQIVLSEPDDSDFVGWDELKNELTVSEWAQPLVESALKVRGGDAFLVTSAALEFLRTKTSFDAPEPEQVNEDEAGDEGNDGRDQDDDYSTDDLSEAGAGWLSEQGFETLDH